MGEDTGRGLRARLIGVLAGVAAIAVVGVGAAPAQADGETISVSGTVVDADGTAVPGVTLLAGDPAGHNSTVVSGDDGSYTVAGVDPGVVEIDVVPSLPQPAAVPAGLRIKAQAMFDADTTGVDLTLPAVHLVTVTVTDHDGDAVAGAQVTRAPGSDVDSSGSAVCPGGFLPQATWETCSQSLVGQPAATAGDDGTVSLPMIDATAGGAVLTATDPANAARTDSAESDLVTDVDDDVSLVLPDAPAAPGGVAVGISFPSVGASTSTGTVTWSAPADDGGAPVQQYVVSATPADPTVATPDPVAVPVTDPATGAANPLSASFTGLDAAATYAFSVVVVNAVDAGPSATVSRQADNRSATTLTLVSSVTTASAGQQVRYTATVSGVGSVPAGQIAFVVDGHEHDVALTKGAASWRQSFATDGQHSVTATYFGDNKNHAVSRASYTQVVSDLVPTSTKAKTAPGPSTYPTKAISLVATVKPASGAIVSGGTVSFAVSTTVGGTDQTTAYGPVAVTSGGAKLGIGKLAVGTYRVVATYSGDATHTGSVSQTYTLTIVGTSG